MLVGSILIVSLFLPACAYVPNGASDPLGVGDAIGRCIGPNAVPVENRALPDWFAMFGPALACR